MYYVLLSKGNGEVMSEPQYRAMLAHRRCARKASSIFDFRTTVGLVVSLSVILIGQQAGREGTVDLNMVVKRKPQSKSGIERRVSSRQERILMGIADNTF
jgi:hypothetical protein